MGDMLFEMVLDAWSPVSSISEPVRGRLARVGLLEPTRPSMYRVRDLKIARQSVPDMEVRVSRRVTVLGADGAIGLNYLAQFDEIRFSVPALRLTLVDP